MRGSGGSGGESAEAKPEKPPGATASNPTPTPPTTPQTSTPVPPANPVGAPATPAGAVVATGSLEIATVPTQARISLDGKSQSRRSNATLSDVPAGDVSVKVEKDGYLPQTRTVQVQPGGSVRASFTLEPNPNLPGTLEIKVSPYATYFVDEQQVAANVASTRQSIKPGIHSVRVVHSAFDPKEWKNIRVEPGKTLTLTYDFIAASKVTLRVTADPWAEVVIDGQRTGKFTPFEVQLPTGNHTVTVLREGFSIDGGAQTVTLRSGPPVSVSFKLKKS